MRLLIDMDGVLADFEAGFLEAWRAQHPELPYIPVAERQLFYLSEEYPSELRPLVREVLTAPGFFRNLAPLPGGLEALQALEGLGHQVFICTSPLRAYQNCVGEKFAWVDAHLGQAWVKRIVLTSDKTLVQGDILVDDRPEVTGIQTPSWEHVVFDAPYNRASPSRRRINWENWRTVLFPE
jgi:5'-nucleotidase